MDDVREEWLPFYMAVEEIAQAFAVNPDMASMTLYGLCASGEVRSRAKEGGGISPARWAGGEVWDGSDLPAITVSASDLRYWLSSQAGPERAMLDQEITKRLRNGQNPPRNILWKQFYDEVRDACNGWKNADRKEHGYGFGDKTIQRAVNRLRGN